MKPFRTFLTSAALVGAALLFSGASATADTTQNASGPALSGAAGSVATAHKHHHKVYHAAADAVPDFTLDTVAGGTFHLRKHIGQVVLIDFWATWCGPCRMAIPHLVELQKKFGGRNFTVVGVSLDQQGINVVRDFAQSWKLNYPVVVDQGGALAQEYGGIRAIPTTLVIDREGRIVGAPLVGYRPLEDYEQLVRQALHQS